MMYIILLLSLFISSEDCLLYICVRFSVYESLWGKCEVSLNWAILVSHNIDNLATFNRFTLPNAKFNIVPSLCSNLQAITDT